MDNHQVGYFLSSTAKKRARRKNIFRIYIHHTLIQGTSQISLAADKENEFQRSLETPYNIRQRRRVMGWGFGALEPLHDLYLEFPSISGSSVGGKCIKMFESHC